MKENANTNVYQTGSTTPPKSHQGLIALLLCVVIFLTGIVTALSVMNVQMFRLLQTKAPVAESVSFSRSAEPVVAGYSPEESLFVRTLGLQGQNVDGIVGGYFRYPDGVYVCFVEQESPAQKAGVAVGDILVEVEQKAVTDTDSLAEVLARLPAGKQITVTVFREGNYLKLNAVLE